MLTTLKCGQAQSLMEKEKPQDGYGFLTVDEKRFSD